MTQRLIEMKYIKAADGYPVGKIVAVTRMHAGTLEARAVAIRVHPPHSKNKPITSDHTVTKGD